MESNHAMPILHVFYLFLQRDGCGQGMVSMRQKDTEVFHLRYHQLGKFSWVQNVRKVIVKGLLIQDYGRMLKSC